MIYLTPLVFNQIELSATQIGNGLAVAAFAGTLSRLITGYFLDRGTNTSIALSLAVLLAIFADISLLNAQDFKAFLIGQLFLGTAAGLYWPSVELAVPSSCGRFPSSKGFALVRSADALGTSIGVLFGSFSALIGAIRVVYLIDLSCMIYLLFVLTKKPIKDKRAALVNRIQRNPLTKENKRWFFRLLPILGLSLLATSIFSLLQSALPLDLVNGGVFRPPLSEGWSGTILTIQLGLLVIFQWPIGHWLSQHNQRFGLSISISSFCIGCLLLGVSALWVKGIILVVIAQIPLSFGLAAFLPTATEAIIQVPPIEHRGIAMAMFSQCFAISALLAPTLGGIVIDKQGTAMLIWLSMSLTCFAMLPLTRLIKTSRQNI